MKRFRERHHNGAAGIYEHENGELVLFEPVERLVGAVRNLDRVHLESCAKVALSSDRECDCGMEKLWQILEKL